MVKDGDNRNKQMKHAIPPIKAEIDYLDKNERNSIVWETGCGKSGEVCMGKAGSRRTAIGRLG